METADSASSTSPRWITGIIVAAALFHSGCLWGGETGVSVSHQTLLPDSVASLAVAVVSPISRGSFGCTAMGEVEGPEPALVARSVASLFSDELLEHALVTGPVEVSRGAANGRVLGNIPVGEALVFVEGFDASGWSQGLACGGPLVVEAGTTATVELNFVSTP